ncbi:HD domain-containing protein [Desulfonema limicola]|uniref:HD domain-containing protein n=1 Tax=Desulfonema limicola TaxID=45656 RepID=A0A975GFP2_9BACT|nr:HD domain-containing phosphohydrolase [Desulfonema limicola]QTA79467.1 HD domain-containing protein [Desulfonema limicola]
MAVLRNIKPDTSDLKTNMIRADTVPAGAGLSFQSLESDRERLYDSLVDYAGSVFSAIRNQQKIPLDKGFELVKKMTENHLPEDPVFIKSIHHDSLEDYYIFHCVNTAVYAVKMADNLKWPVNKQIELGVGALFHDLGMAMVPEKIIYKKESLTDKELQIIKNRPRMGYKILMPFAETYPWLPVCALQAHERIDGSGYPDGIKGDDIHEYAQLSGLAGVYEALIHSRPQGEKYLYSSAVKEIIRTNKKSFKSQYLKALLNVFSIFPIYSYVRLNTDIIGKVLETYPDQPMRPKIQVVYDMKKHSPVSDKRIVNLPDNSLLNIVDSISETDIKGLFYNE